MRKQKQRLRLAGMLLLALLAVLLCVWLELGGRSYAIHHALEEQPGLLDDLSIFSVDALSFSDDTRIFPWYDASGRAVLFLPSCTKDRPVQLRIDHGFDLLLDGERVKNGRKLVLRPGPHSIALPEYGKEYPLEVMQSEQLPAVWLRTDSGTLTALHEQEQPESGRITIMEPDGSRYQEEFSVLRRHGNVSWGDTEKKGYQLNLKHAANLTKTEFSRKWLLLANAFDPSMLRNQIVFDLGQALDMEFVPDARFAELYLNGEYRGLYQIYEKIELAPGRLELEDLEHKNLLANPTLKEPNELTKITEPGDNFSGERRGYALPSLPQEIDGGYLLEQELPIRDEGEGRCGFRSSRGHQVIVKEPTCADLRQVKYIQERYQSMENAAFAPDGIDPVSGQHFTELLDLRSFACKYLLEELSKNQDAANTSQYLYKHPDRVSPRLFAGPLWDYDNSLWVRRLVADYTGDVIYDLSDPAGFYASDPLTPSNLWYALYRQPVFREEAARIFRTELLPAVQQEVSAADRTAEQLLPAVLMDAVRWERWPECTDPQQRENAYFQAVKTVSDFLLQRADWLDGQWSGQTESTE